MNDHWSAEREAAATPVRGIEFTGSWREYLPIALSNALLTVVTLGVYRYWAAARQRRYLWSRTIVIDDPLEWTGTGKEMFIGFLVVMAVLLPFFLFFQFAFPAMVARGKAGAAGGIFTLFYIGIIYLGGLARFRALRYRLSRTWWHGIRGGSDEPGWNYGGEYLGRIALSAMTMWVMFPWAAVRLWNGRWNQMSFGSLPFVATLTTEGLKRRWAAIYLIPLAMLVVGGIVAAIGAASLLGSNRPLTVALIIGSIVVVFYLAIPLATLHWYAKYYRRAADSLSLGGLEFGFDATTWGWLKLFLGNLALAVVTLGFGLTYWGYRNWSFMVRHLHIYGEIHIDQTHQSTTSAPGEAEGFADAFDLGAL
ncbi:MAG: YjgN family protein [Sphingomicrobium sp.]|nr:DUF898 domain-containing protein [Sphingomonadales bacterium]